MRKLIWGCTAAVTVATGAFCWCAERSVARPHSPVGRAIAALGLVANNHPVAQFRAALRDQRNATQPYQAKPSLAAEEVRSSGGEECELVCAAAKPPVGRLPGTIVLSEPVVEDVIIRFPDPLTFPDPCDEAHKPSVEVTRVQVRMPYVDRDECEPKPAMAKVPETLDGSEEAEPRRLPDLPIDPAHHGQYPECPYPGPFPTPRKGLPFLPESTPQKSESRKVPVPEEESPIRQTGAWRLAPKTGRPVDTDCPEKPRVQPVDTLDFRPGDAGPIDTRSRGPF